MPLRSDPLAFDESYGVFRPGRPAIRPDRILRLQGYKDLSKVRPQIRDAAETMASRAESLIAAEVHYRIASVVARDGEGLTLDGGIGFSSPAFRRFLPKAEQVVALVVTLGDGIDQDVIGMIERFEPLEALLLESAGWLGIEWATKAFSDHLRRAVGSQGYSVSLRMAPGYSYRLNGESVTWPLEQQRELFALFAGHTLPVTLLESCAMKPKMSRSGLYGLDLHDSDRCSAPVGRLLAQGSLGSQRPQEEKLSTRRATGRLGATSVQSYNARGVGEG